MPRQEKLLEAWLAEPTAGQNQSRPGRRQALRSPISTNPQTSVCEPRHPMSRKGAHGRSLRGGEQAQRPPGGAPRGPVGPSPAQAGAWPSASSSPPSTNTLPGALTLCSCAFRSRRQVRGWGGPRLLGPALLLHGSVGGDVPMPRAACRTGAGGRWGSVCHPATPRPLPPARHLTEEPSASQGPCPPTSTRRPPDLTPPTCPRNPGDHSGPTGLQL